MFQNAGCNTAVDMQEDLNNVSRWLVANKVTVNTDEYQMPSSVGSRPISFDYFGKSTSFKDSCRYIGVIKEKKLCFKKHISSVWNKLKKICGVSYKIRLLRTFKFLLMFYTSYAKSLISYGLLVIGCTSKRHVSQIDVAKCRVLRKRFSKRKDESMTCLMKANGISFVYELYLFEVFKE